MIFEPSIRGNPHLLIVGIPGMGKTTSLLNTCVELITSGIAPFIIDFHGDLTSVLRGSLGHGTFSVLDASQGLAFNPLEPGEDLRGRPNGWVEHYFEVAEIFGDLYPGFGELQVGQIRDSLRACYVSAGFDNDYTSAAAPSVYDFWNHLQASARSQRDLKKIVARLQAVFDLRLFGGQGDQISFKDLLARPTIIDLHGIRNQDNQRVAASFFLQRIYRFMFTRAGPESLLNAVVLDEAHRLASLALIARIMQECRKYGIMFILSSQRVDDFQQGVLDSAGNQLCLRVNHPDAKRIAKYLASDDSERKDLQARLMELPRHQALFHTEGYRRPKKLTLSPPG